MRAETRSCLAAVVLSGVAEVQKSALHQKPAAVPLHQDATSEACNLLCGFNEPSLRDLFSFCGACLR